MNTVELLELAAKAAGVGELIFRNGADDDGYDDGVLKYIWYKGDNRLINWNPLEDDGDAFRLAVKLNLSYSANGEYVVVHGFGWPNLVIHRFTGGVLEAVRLAIVMAAAKLGKGM